MDEGEEEDAEETVIEDTTAQRAARRDTIHVFPFHGGHMLDGTDCWCMPRVERERYADLVIHNQYAAGVKRPRKEC